MTNFMTDRNNVFSITNLDMKFYAINSPTISELSIPTI